MLSSVSSFGNAWRSCFQCSDIFGDLTILGQFWAIRIFSGRISSVKLNWFVFWILALSRQCIDEDEMLSISSIKSPLQIFWKRIVHFAMVLSCLFGALGALNNIFGARASTVYAPFLTCGSLDFMALLMVCITCLHCCLNLSGHFLTATIFCFEMCSASDMVTSDPRFNCGLLRSLLLDPAVF